MKNILENQVVTDFGTKLNELSKLKRKTTTKKTAIKIGCWYKFAPQSTTLPGSIIALIEKEYSPLKIISIEGKLCTCKHKRMDYTWNWSKDFIKQDFIKISKAQAFEELL